MATTSSSMIVGRLIPLITLQWFLFTEPPFTLVRRFNIHFRLYSAWYIENFDRVHAHAAANNLRVIALQRRGYPGSSTFTEAEMAEMKSGSNLTLDGFAISMAHFVNYLAYDLSVPKVSGDRKSGGVALVAWSMAALVVMPLLSDFEVIPKELHPVLEDYVKDLIFYGDLLYYPLNNNLKLTKMCSDPSELSLGIVIPENNLYKPLADPKYETMEEKFINFVFWVDHYFKFPANWSGDINALDSEKRENCGTFDGWPKADVLDLIDVNAAAYDMPLYVISIFLYVSILNFHQSFRVYANHN